MEFLNFGYGNLTLPLKSHYDDIAQLSSSPPTANSTHMHPNFLYGKVLPDGRPNFLTDYGFNFQHYGSLGSSNHSKCCNVSSPFATKDINFGHLYTIGKTEKEERTYDEPYTGDLSRRSWFCCPGSQIRTECDQPPLLEKIKTPTTPSEVIIQPPAGLNINNNCNGTCERLQNQLDEQAQRYEEQLTELHSVIAELTRKLHQQRTMAITEEDEISESCTSAHDESITCPLEVSELEPLENENELSDMENKVHQLAESPLELPEPKLIPSSNKANSSEPSPSISFEIIEPLKQEITSLKQQLHEAHTRLAQITLNRIEQQTTIIEDDANKNNLESNHLYKINNSSGAGTLLESPESHIKTDCCEPKNHNNQDIIKFSSIVPIHKTGTKGDTFNIPITKVAERIKLKRSSDRDVSPNDLINGELSTAVAEHIVGDILRQCDAHTEKQSLDFEIRKINAKLEHARSQNTVLTLTLNETKDNCDRLTLLCGKYESNAIALRLALGFTDRTIEAYDVLLALLETELSMNEENPVTLENRTAAETVAKQLLNHLDNLHEHQDNGVLLSPWQSQVYCSPIELEKPWTTDDELRLREQVSKLKAERSIIQNTYVTLESTHVENLPIRAASSQDSRKMDLEMAVLMQELMSLREDKNVLLAKLFILERERNALEIKLKYVEAQQKAQSATLKNLQGQLKDTEGLLALATQNKDRGYCDAEHAQGVEFELMQALAREARLKIRLQELVTTLEQVTKNAEARLLEGREIVQDLNQSNSILTETVDRNNKKYQAKFKKMEHQIMNMAEKHTVQVHTLQQRIATLETPPTNSSENSLNSIPM